MDERQFEFEWDDVKAGANTRKHGVSFELASTVFHDSLLLSVPDLEHSEAEERWFSIGCAATGAILCVVYLWSEPTPGTVRVRLISARPAVGSEIRQYEENP